MAENNKIYNRRSKKDLLEVILITPILKEACNKFGVSFHTFFSDVKKLLGLTGAYEEIHNTIIETIKKEPDGEWANLLLHLGNEWLPWEVVKYHKEKEAKQQEEKNKANRTDWSGLNGRENKGALPIYRSGQGNPYAKPQVFPKIGNPMHTTPGAVSPLRHTIKPF